MVESNLAFGKHGSDPLDRAHDRADLGPDLGAPRAVARGTRAPLCPTEPDPSYRPAPGRARDAQYRRGDPASGRSGAARTAAGRRDGASAGQSGARGPDDRRVQGFPVRPAGWAEADP